MASATSNTDGSHDVDNKHNAEKKFPDPFTQSNATMTVCIVLISDKYSILGIYDIVSLVVYTSKYTMPYNIQLYYTHGNNKIFMFSYTYREVLGWSIDMMNYCSYTPTSFNMQRMHVTVNNKLRTSFDCYTAVIVRAKHDKMHNAQQFST